LKIPYLLRFWKIFGACLIDSSTNIVDHYGALLTQREALVDLQ
jgi:hypothetical protein